jgi:hypothetical protein
MAVKRVDKTTDLNVRPGLLPLFLARAGAIFGRPALQLAGVMGDGQVFLAGGKIL